MAKSPPLPAPGDRWALFLDVDGTLLPIAATPRAVQVEPALLQLLERLERVSGGALALISGRSLLDIDRLFSPLRLPAAGLHGWQRRRVDGTLVKVSEPTAVLQPLRPVLADYAAAHPGLLLEDKVGSLALHYRLAPNYAAAVCRLARHLVAGEPRLRLIEGRKVVELQPLGADKGAAVAAFLGEPPFAGRFALYAGDDRTDEDGFHAVNRLGGLSVRVAGPERIRLPSAAQYVLPSVAALREWLAALAERLEPAEEPDRPAPAERQQSLVR